MPVNTLFLSLCFSHFLTISLSIHFPLPLSHSPSPSPSLSYTLSPLHFSFTCYCSWCHIGNAHDVMTEGGQTGVKFRRVWCCGFTRRQCCCLCYMRCLLSSFLRPVRRAGFAGLPGLQALALGLIAWFWENTRPPVLLPWVGTEPVLFLMRWETYWK